MYSYLCCIFYYCIILFFFLFFFFFFNDTATTEIYTLSLHDALPISIRFQIFKRSVAVVRRRRSPVPTAVRRTIGTDRKSTRLNSSHSQISYAVFCLKKKKKQSNDFILRHSYAA